MSRLKIAIENEAVQTVERLYKDLERRIVASPPGICPVDLALNFLRLCHAQTCGKCVPCRIGLGQLATYLEDVLDGRATMATLGEIERLAKDIEISADCAIGTEAARMVLRGLDGFRIRRPYPDGQLHLPHQPARALRGAVPGRCGYSGLHRAHP